MIDHPTIRLLEDPVLRIPKARSSGSLVDLIRESDSRFLDLLRRFRGRVGERLQERLYWTRELASSIEAAVELGLQGRRWRAWGLMEDILDEHFGWLRRMSLRHSATVVGSRSWYRLTTSADARWRRDIFHRPFDLVSPAYRYSAPGRPALYLSNNVYVCWLECGSPSPLSKCKVARFEIDAKQMDFLDLPANHDAYLSPLTVGWGLRHLAEFDPRKFMNSPYLSDVEAEVVEYLALWPLLMACSVETQADSERPAPEHLVSQLLAQWVIKQGEWLGIRYFTTKFDETAAGGSNDMSINAVLPARTTEKREGFCDFLVERVRCTPPQSFDDAMRVLDNDLFTKDAADRRQASGGRYMVKWEGALQEYQHTPFGRMEYWLDRDDIPARQIDA